MKLWDEAAHPRDPGGEFGGWFVPKIKLPSIPAPLPDVDLDYAEALAYLTAPNKSFASHKGNGDGHVMTSGGDRWGRYGAAGVLFAAKDPNTGQFQFLLGARAPSGFKKDKSKFWSTFGGALNQDENSLVGALREAGEELHGALPKKGKILRRVITSTPASDWHYTTFVIDVTDDPDWDPDAKGWEHSETGWFLPEEMGQVDLLPAFKENIDQALGVVPLVPPPTPTDPAPFIYEHLKEMKRGDFRLSSNLRLMPPSLKLAIGELATKDENTDLLNALLDSLKPPKPPSLPKVTPLFHNFPPGQVNISGTHKPTVAGPFELRWKGKRVATANSWKGIANARKLLAKHRGVPESEFIIHEPKKSKKTELSAV